MENELSDMIKNIPVHDNHAYHFIERIRPIVLHRLVLLVHELYCHCSSDSPLRKQIRGRIRKAGGLPNDIYSIAHELTAEEVMDFLKVNRRTAWDYLLTIQAIVTNIEGTITKKK